MNKISERNNLIYKINSWLSLYYEDDYDHKYIVNILFDRILHFISKNKLVLTCDKDVFMDYFIEYLYTYSSHKPYKIYEYDV